MLNGVSPFWSGYNSSDNINNVHMEHTSNFWRIYAISWAGEFHRVGQTDHRFCLAISKALSVQFIKGRNGSEYNERNQM